MWRTFIHPLREIKWMWQRSRRGWADKDIWSFDSYLSDIVKRGVRLLAMNQHGCPHVLYDESRVNDECWKWEEILEEIAQGFEAAEEMQRSCMVEWGRDDSGRAIHHFSDERRKQLTEKFDRGMELFHKYYFNLWT